MNRFPLILGFAALALLSACGDNSAPPPAQAANTEAAPKTTTPTRPNRPVQTVPIAPVPGTVTEEPAQTDVANLEEAPLPEPASSRPLSREARAVLAPLFGVWAADLGRCDSDTIAISQSRFEGAESGCDIVSLVPTNDRNGSITATLSCRSGGNDARERIAMVPLFAPSGEGIGLTYLDRDNYEVTVLRCN